MIILASTSDLVKVITGSALNLDVHASYLDFNGTAVTPGAQDTNISTATTTTVVSSPGSSVQRNIKTLTFHNKDASNSNLITIEHVSSTGPTTVVLHAITLPAGYTFSTDGVNWLLLDANGNQVVSSNTPGRFLKATTILTGTTSFTTSSATNSIWARLLGSGASGGGNPATAGTAGGGGSAGGYAEWVVAVSPSTTYTCAVGASKTGTSNAAGTNGSATTLTIGATTCTANGGNAGAVGTTAIVAAAGGAAPSVSTNGTLNASGASGQSSVVFATPASVGSPVGGAGGSCDFGGGGLGATTAAGAVGGNAVGFGGGGGGSTAGTAATARAGGSSAAGLLIIYEYS